MRKDYNNFRGDVASYFKIKNKIINDDLLLKKIHLSRAGGDLPQIVTNYLMLVFEEKKDVRFFNELLWLNDNKGVNIQPSIDLFLKQIQTNGTYAFCYSNDLIGNLDVKGDKDIFLKPPPPDISICLIGSPFHFIIPFLMFRRLKINVDVINIKYHKNKIVSLILNNKLMSIFYKLLFNSKNYFEIKIKDKKALKSIKLSKKYDVGFHKLSFIISDSLIDQFRLGLINDHWGVLPLFKGRSALSYSKLFGANLIITNHLVKKEIDAGQIILYSDIDRKAIKRTIYLGLGERIVKSVFLLIMNKTKDQINNSYGKIFYEMHPWLLDYVKRKHK